MKGQSIVASLMMCLGVCVVPVAVGDHHEEGPKYMIVHHDEISPANAAAYEANARAWVEAFTKAEMGPEWAWYGSQHDFTYTWVSEIESYAYLDGEADRRKQMVEKLGEETMASLRDGEKYVVSHSTELVKVEPSLSFNPAASSESGPPGFLRISVMEVNASMDEQFRDLIKRVIEANKAAEATAGWNTYSIEFGRHAYIVVSMATDAAEYYGRTPFYDVLVKGTGSQEAAGAMMQEWTQYVSHYETQDSRALGELSYVPMPDMEDMEENEEAGGEGSE